MYPKTIKGKTYCYESIRIDKRYTTTRSYGRCEPNNKTACKTCNYNQYLKNKGKNPQNKRKNILNIIKYSQINLQNS